MLLGHERRKEEGTGRGPTKKEPGSRVLFPGSLQTITSQELDPRSSYLFTPPRPVYRLVDHPTRCAFPLRPLRNSGLFAAFVPTHGCGPAPDFHRTSRLSPTNGAPEVTHFFEKRITPWNERCQPKLFPANRYLLLTRGRRQGLLCHLLSVGYWPEFC